MAVPDVRRAFGAVSCAAAGLSVVLLLLAFLDKAVAAGSALPLLVWAACSALTAGTALLLALVVDVEREATYGGWLLTLATVAFLVFAVVGFGAA